MKPTVLVIATTAAGTHAALAAAVPLARGEDADLAVLVPHIVSSSAELAVAPESVDAIKRCYEEMARSLGANANVEVVASVGLGDVIARACAAGTRVVIGGPVGRWLTSPEERFANRLTALGCSVVFVASGPNRTQRRVTAALIVLTSALVLGPGRVAYAQQPEPEKNPEPFAFADFTWLSGNPRTKESPIDTKVFTGEFRADTNFTYSFNKPIDDTIGGSTEIFRSGEFQVTQLGIGGDFHYDNVIGRVMTQFGMYAQTTPRNDASPGRGQWDLNTAYRYLSEAYGGYHFDKMNGINVEAGIFMSYIGLWSYYNFDNWTYQPSYVSSNTPWFFNGMRVQIFPNDKLKIEPWLINGWQSYGKFNHAPGAGGQVLWRPNGNWSFVFNNYWGTDTLGNPDRKRIHTDDSLQWKYYDKPDAPISKAAMTFTFDGGCEYGGGVVCHGGDAATPSQFFLGFMTYQRAWFDHDRYALTFGGGAINNPGRYLVLMPPVNGATAFSGTPYFTYNPGDPYKAWDTQTTFDFMPSQFITFRAEYNYRHANVPYFTGEGGLTPPGGNTGAPGSLVPGWAPDLRNSEKRVTFALLVKL